MNECKCKNGNGKGTYECPLHKKNPDGNYWFDKKQNQQDVEEENQDEE